MINNLRDYPAAIVVFTDETNKEHCNMNVCGVMNEAMQEVYKELQDVSYEFTVYMKQKDTWFDPTTHLRLPNEAFVIKTYRKIELEHCLRFGHCSVHTKEKVRPNGTEKDVFYWSVRLYRNGI
jgi:hypothetical protein